jgi:hypothetical protein
VNLQTGNGASVASRAPAAILGGRGRPRLFTPATTRPRAATSTKSAGGGRRSPSRTCLTLFTTLVDGCPR